MAKILDGKATAQSVQAEVASAVASLKEKHGVTPGLAAVLVGDNPASAIYVRNKARACADVGMYAETFHLPKDTPREELLSLIRRLNDDQKFHGILIQLPLPEHLDEIEAMSLVSPYKDVDCLHPLNVGLLAQGRARFIPATPGGVQQLLLRYGYNPDGKRVVICGRSNVVGKPLALLLIQKNTGANATVTICHTGTRDLPDVTRQADILIVAMGRANTITADMVKDGAVVIDVGTNRIPDSTRKQGYRLVGDVDFDAVAQKAEAITPVPGGVGPMTIAMLLVNTATAARLSVGNPLTKVS
jgi:methylenetetrahydrofolate dehydrogenase (NADP+)/methenyltetrahydrofolate cyclohydrolase